MKMTEQLSDLIQAMSADALAKALYSASVELQDTEPCFLDCHEMRLLPKKTTLLRLELILSLLPLQISINGICTFPDGI